MEYIEVTKMLKQLKINPFDVIQKIVFIEFTRNNQVKWKIFYKNGRTQTKWNDINKHL